MSTWKRCNSLARTERRAKAAGSQFHLLFCRGKDITTTARDCRDAGGSADYRV